MTSRGRKILWISVGSIAGLLALLVLGVFVLVQTNRFQQFVTSEIVTAVEKATGGRAEVGSIQIELGGLRATIRNFVLHGLEGPDDPPLARIDRLVVVASLLPSAGGFVGIHSVDIEHPEVNVTVDQNGRSNIPTPADRTPSEKTPLETVVDLAIGSFEVRNGVARFQQQSTPFSAQGEDLRARLDFNSLLSRYQGTISAAPLRLQRGRTPLDLQVNIPLTIERDRAAISSASIRSPHSQVNLSGEIQNLRDAKVTLDLKGDLSVMELADAGGLGLTPARGAPDRLQLVVNGTFDQGALLISVLNAGLGRSLIDASGRFGSASLNDGSLNLHGDLVLDELSLLAANSPKMSGRVSIQGLARIASGGNYTVDASVRGTGLGVRQGRVVVSNAQLQATIQADPQRVRADPLRLDIAGGRIQAKAELQQQNNYRVDGNLAGVDIQQLLAIAGTPAANVGGTISGTMQARGELKGVAVQQASADLAIAPNGRGLPIRGQLRPNYSSASDSVDLAQSFLALPNSRLDLSGAVNRRLDVHFTSRNLDDLQPLLAAASPQAPASLPIRLSAGGLASVNAVVTGTLSAPTLSGDIQFQRFQAQDRRFDSLTGEFAAASTGARVSNVALRSGNLDARLSGSIGLEQWKPLPRDPVSLDASLRNGDLRDVLALAGQSDIPARGALTFQARVTGTVGDPQGSAQLQLRRGEAYGEPLDSIDAQVSAGGTRVLVDSLRVVSNGAVANMNGSFDHPQESFSSGRVQGHVTANQIGLARISAVQKQRPGLDGAASADLDLIGTLNPPAAQQRFELNSVNGRAAVQNVRYRNENLGDLSAEVSTQGRAVTYAVNSNFAGSSIRVDGSTELTASYPTRARVDLRDLPIDKVAEVAGQNIDAVGRLALRGDVAGTISNPEADVNVELTQARYMDQPIDSVAAKVSYHADRIELADAELRIGANRLTGSATFTHPPQNFQTGDLKVSVATNSIQLAQLRALQSRKPGFTGAVEVQLDAEGRLNQARPTLPVQLSALNARVQARNVAQNGVSFGDANVRAVQRGQTVDVQVDSNLAQSNIQGTASVQLAENYPTSAQVKVEGVQYSRWMQLLGNNDLRNSSFDAALDGTIQARGLALRPRELTGTAEFTRAEVYANTRGSLGRQGRRVTLRNDGPIRFAVNPSGIQVQQARWTGPSTTVALTGSVGLEPTSGLNLKLNANADLKLLRDFDPNVSSEGSLTVNAAVGGQLREPTITGSIELRDAAYQQTSMLNGISKANGVIDLNGTSATIRNLTAQSGGGDITVSGNVNRSEGLYRFNLQTRLRGVRVRTPEGASVVADAQLRLTGTDKNSLLAGNVTVRVVSFNARTDVGSILTQAAPPVETPSGNEGLLDAMRLNIDVRMGSTTTFRTTFAQNLEATADLTVRGTAAQPGMLGRIVITQGELVFFGTKYTVNEANIAFYNPTRIEPVLNLSLNTTARGVSVDLVVTGPVTNMALSYRSDPPLQFTEIVSLLAAGKVPTSDPVLLSRQPPTQQQSLPQMGASALLGAAVANPVAGQLQRVFGVSQLKIDPTFTSGAELPQARLTLQQQITSDLTFTYITNVTRSDPQIVRVEWVIGDNWSAIATRQENGMVGVDVFYKKRFQ